MTKTKKNRTRNRLQPPASTERNRRKRQRARIFGKPIKSSRARRRKNAQKHRKSEGGS